MSATNSHPGLSFGVHRRATPFAPTHLANPAKSSTHLSQHASPYQPQAYAPQQVPQAAYPHHLFSNSAPSISSVSSVSSVVSVQNGARQPQPQVAPSLPGPRQRTSAPRQMQSQTSSSLSYLQQSLNQPTVGPQPLNPQQLSQQSLSQQQSLGQPSLGQPPLSQPPLGQPPLGQQQHLSQSPLSQPPMNQQPPSQQTINKQPLRPQSLSQQPISQQPVSQQPIINQQPLCQQPMSQPPMSQQSHPGQALSQPPVTQSSGQQPMSQPVSQGESSIHLPKPAPHTPVQPTLSHSHQQQKPQTQQVQKAQPVPQISQISQITQIAQITQIPHIQQLQQAQQIQQQPAPPPPEPVEPPHENHHDDDMDMGSQDESGERDASLEAKLADGSIFVPRQPMGPMMSAPMEGGSFPTLEAVHQYVLAYCTSVGYAIVIGRSKKTVPGLKKVLFVCDRAGKPPRRVSPELRKRKTSSRKCDCQFGFFAIEQRTQWTIRYRPDNQHLQHNHGPSESPLLHPAARKLDSKMVAAVKQLKDSGVGVSQTLEILQTEHPHVPLLPRDIYNARAAITRNPNKVATGLAENRAAIYNKPHPSAEDRIRADLRREIAKAREDYDKLKEDNQKEIDELRGKLRERDDKIREKDKMIEKFEMFIDVLNQRVMVKLSNDDNGSSANGNSSTSEANGRASTSTS